MPQNKSDLVREALRRGLIDRSSLVAEAQRRGLPVPEPTASAEPRHPSSAFPSAPTTPYQQPGELATALRRRPSTTEKTIGTAADFALPIAGGVIGGIPGMAGGAMLSDYLQQRYATRTGQQESYSPLRTLAQGAGTAALAGTGRLIAQAAGAGGGIKVRAIGELEKRSFGGLNLLRRPRPASLVGQAEEVGLAGELEQSISKVGGRFSSRLLPEVEKINQAATRATQAGKTVDVRPTLDRLFKFIKPGVQEPTQLAAQNRLVGLAAKYEKEAAATGGRLTTERALELLRELRVPVAGKFESGVGTLYQKGLKFAQRPLELMIKRSLDPAGRRAFFTASRRLDTIERVQKFVTRDSAPNTIRNLWSGSQNEALEALRAYDKANGTDFLKRSYDLAIRHELQPDELSTAHRLIQSILPIVGWAWLAGSRTFGKFVATINRPATAAVGATARRLLLEMGETDEPQPQAIP